MKANESAAIMLANLVFDWLHTNQKSLYLIIKDQFLLLQKGEDNTVLIREGDSTIENKNIFFEGYSIKIGHGDHDELMVTVAKGKLDVRYSRTPEKITFFD